MRWYFHGDDGVGLGQNFLLSCELEKAHAERVAQIKSSSIGRQARRSWIRSEGARADTYRGEKDLQEMLGAGPQEQEERWY